MIWHPYLRFTNNPEAPPAPEPQPAGGGGGTERAVHRKKRAVVYNESALEQIKKRNVDEVETQIQAAMQKAMAAAKAKQKPTDTAGRPLTQSVVDQMNDLDEQNMILLLMMLG